MKDTLLFAEGFIGAAGSMVSETAIGAVDLTQIIGIASIDGVNRLTGGQTPEWMKRDLQGTADNLSSLAELGVGAYTALTDPGAAQRGQDPNASYADKAAYRAQEIGKALWDKVTHMDAYDAGGLTFEVASLFVGPAAVGKMAKGTKLGAKAAEMIQLAKNSTKARVLANVEKWGSKVDNILAKSNNVIGKFGEKLLDTRIPVGIRKEAVAFAGGMGTMPAFSVENKTLRDVMHFSSKHADDVVRVAEKPFDKERLLQNLKESRLARESSNFKEYVAKEKDFFEGIAKNKRFEAFGKGELSFDDVLSDYVSEYTKLVESNTTWNWNKDIREGANLTGAQRRLIKNESIRRGLLPKVAVRQVEGLRYGYADFKGAGLVQETVQLPKELWKKTDRERFKWLNGFREGMTWHHTEVPGKMELVPFGIHNIVPHNGGRTIGHWADAIR